MKLFLRGKAGGLAVFLLISGLVAGGLGWVTAAALRLEDEQLQARAREEEYETLRLALLKLDSRILPVLAREESRPYSHYCAVFAPSLALRNDGQVCQPGAVLEPSPLLSADLPDWILLHFQADEDSGWASPEVLSQNLARRLEPARDRLANATPLREKVLADLAKRCPPVDLLAAVQKRGLQLTQEEIALVPSQAPPANNMENNSQLAQSAFPNAQAAAGPSGGVNFNPNSGMNSYPQQLSPGDYASRRGQQSRVMNEVQRPAAQQDDPAVALGNLRGNGQDWFSPNRVKPARSAQVPVSLSPMVPLWLDSGGQEWLVVARLVQVGKKQVCQGLVLDWPKLQELLAREADPPFPNARLEPVRAEVPPHPERTMTALPVQLDTGLPDPLPAPGWTPLRVGLAAAWAAALVALLAVALGGWSLIRLSERRIGFVSAVTHELRTPLTTLRLYLDMLASGMVQGEEQRAEYLHTLNAEADRLNRLVGNVLHFSRLENQKPRTQMGPVAVRDLLEQVRSTWQGRCQDAGKELVVDNAAGETVLVTDTELVQQILGNLVDNACKYSRGAKDARLWVRALPAGHGRMAFEVEDRGPGVPARERRSIFRPFRRGRAADVTAGGVGLGLALAQRWARLLGGHLTLQTGREKAGACFRLELRSER